jgi:hypothetical protein
MEIRVITSHSVDLVLRVVDGVMEIVPPAPSGNQPSGEFVGESEGNNREA